MNARICFFLAGFCIVGCRDNAAPQSIVAENPAVLTSTEVEQTVGTQTFGDFSFSIPTGWSVAKPDRDKTKVMLLLDGTNWQNAKAMIKVDVGTPAEPTAMQLAEGFANSAGGSVSADALDFDGTLGVSATTSSEELTTPRNMIIMYRSGKAYLLMVGTTAGVDVDDAVSHIRQSWKWTYPDAE